MREITFSIPSPSGSRRRRKRWREKESAGVRDSGNERKRDRKQEKWNSAAVQINSSCSDVVYIHYHCHWTVKSDWRMSLIKKN